MEGAIKKLNEHESSLLGIMESIKSLISYVNLQMSNTEEDYEISNEAKIEKVFDEMLRVKNSLHEIIEVVYSSDSKGYNKKIFLEQLMNQYNIQKQFNRFENK